MLHLPYRRIGVSLLALVLTGCATSAQLEQCQSLNRSLRDQLDELDAKNKKSLLEIERIQNELGEKTKLLSNQGQLQDAERVKLEAERDGLREDLEQLKTAHKELLEEYARSSRNVPIPAEVKSKLKDFAARTKGFEFDVNRGISKFTADILFDLGKAFLKPNGKTVLGEFAAILSTPSAKDLHILIVGHTDNKPIVQPETKAKHPTNWHLGAHRAIAVQTYLEEKNIAPQRMGIGSYSEYQPVAFDNPAQNRRVEVYVVPPPAGGLVR